MTPVSSTRVGRGARLSPEQRRQQIIEVAIEILGDEDFTELTFDDVARVAGISRNLVYHYFQGRDALVLAATAHESDELRAKILAIDESDVPAKVRAILEIYLDYVEEHAHGYRTVHRYAARSVSTYERLEADQESYANWVLSWGEEPSPIRRLTVRAWVAQLVATCIVWAEDTSQVTREDLIAYHLRTFALATDSLSS